MTVTVVCFCEFDPPSPVCRCLCLIWNSNGDKVHNISLDLLYLFPGPPFLRRIWQMPKIVKCCGQFVGSTRSGAKRGYLIVVGEDRVTLILSFLRNSKLRLNCVSS